MAYQVMIAVDGSEHADLALKFYIDSLHRAENEVILGQVSELPHQSFSFRSGMSVPKEQWEVMLKDAQKKIDDIKDKYSAILKEKNITHRFAHENGHNPGEHIVALAKKEGAQVIVIGCRGMGSVRRTIMGSVSDYVLHHAHVPVVICKK